ncbi:hypothetical protein EOD39_15992 [Acipenser ruthenus]|uniref:Uncharacterized protein n=1 Tax=Acipenser ruthenus TaxID=7906 RepID=A0A444UB40_ACIRT|nr:hypothetical protein EOD39_15992 [Acipenser ruthenus]
MQLLNHAYNAADRHSSLLLPSPVHATLSPASLKSAPVLLTRLQSGVPASPSDTDVVISVPTGRRITQGEAGRGECSVHGGRQQ